MRAEYHIAVTEVALKKLGFVHPSNIRLISDLAESPDNVMKMGKLDMLTPTSSSQVNYNPNKPTPLSTAQEKAIIRGLLATKLRYRVYRIEQIGDIGNELYSRLLYALHGQQQVKELCVMIAEVLRQGTFKPVSIPRLLGNFSHFYIDSVTPVHTYAWSLYLMGEDTDASVLMQRIGEEIDQHDPYEKKAYETRMDPMSRFWKDASNLAEEFGKLAKIPAVKQAMSEPFGIWTQLFSNTVTPVRNKLVLPAGIRSINIPNV